MFLARSIHGEFFLSSAHPALRCLLLAHGWEGQNLCSSHTRTCFSTATVISGIGSVLHGSYYTEVLTYASQMHLVVPSQPHEIKKYTTIAKFTN